MKNDGMNNQEYSFGDEQELNERLSTLINELCHVFIHHADGNWKSIYKPKYVALMAEEIEKHPSLIPKLKALKEPVVSNVTYAAIEQNKSKAGANEST